MARILLLEDDKRARETFVDAFKLMGHESVACAGVRDAIAEYDGNGRVDIIVSDLNLENTRDKGGFRFFEHVDGKDPWQAFIMMTGNPELLSDEEKKKLAGHGAVLLGKPFGF
ncbi:MAG TPA: response regulator, partial [Alphaproteobacteria bacterium]|nr:response regulator [Alphaproteobacteria bacterium]